MKFPAPHPAPGAGEQPQTGIIASISQGSPTIVYCVEEDRLGFQEGDFVKFSEVNGMEELKAAGPYRVKTVKPYMMEIDLDSTHFGAHISGALRVAPPILCPSRIGLESAAAEQ
jgi:ubiquitin-activating enzyme E1